MSDLTKNKLRKRTCCLSAVNIFIIPPHKNALKYTKPKCQISYEWQTIYLVTRFKFPSAKNNTWTSEIRENIRGKEFFTGTRVSCTSTINKNTNDSEINIINRTPKLNWYPSRYNVCLFIYYPSQFDTFSNKLIFKPHYFVLHSDGTYAQTSFSLSFLTHQTSYYIWFSSVLLILVSPHHTDPPAHCQLIRLDELLQNTGKGMEHIGEVIF
jgi:hypothetical protein